MADREWRSFTEVDWEKDLAPIRRQAHELAEQARKQPDEPGGKPATLPSLAFEPGDQVRRIERGPDGTRTDTPVQVVDLASSSAAWITVEGDNRVHADWKFEHAPGTEKAAIESASRVRAESLWAKAQAAHTVRDRSNEPVDVSTAKAEIAQGKQDMRAASQERADGDLLQQTLTIGRQVEAARKAEQPAEQKAETKGRSMRA
jgi:hypothetical protein